MRRPPGALPGLIRTPSGPSGSQGAGGASRPAAAGPLMTASLRPIDTSSSSRPRRGPGPYRGAHLAGADALLIGKPRESGEGARLAVAPSASAARLRRLLAPPIFREGPPRSPPEGAFPNSAVYVRLSPVTKPGRSDELANQPNFTAVTGRAIIPKLR